MFRWKVSILVGLCLFPFVTRAQFNDTTNYYINYASTGIVNKTNDNRSYVVNNHFRFSVYKNHVSLNTTHGFVFGKQQHKVTNRDLTSSVDFNLYQTLPHFYYWGLGVYERNYSLKINQRLQAGAGIGYELIDRKNSLVILSNGILYEKTGLFDQAEAADITYETYRNSFRLKFRFLIRDRVTLESTDFLQHSLEDRHDYIVRCFTSLSVKVIRWLNFTTAFTYNKMSRTQRENLLLNFGLTVERYF
jgi:hypothetical protein